MSLRERIILVLLFILCCYAVTEYGALKYVIVPELNKLEYEQACQTLERSTDALNQQLVDIHNNTISLGASGILTPCTDGSTLSSIVLPSYASQFEFMFVYDSTWQLQASDGLNPDLQAKLEAVLFNADDGFINKQIPGYSQRGMFVKDESLLFISSAAVTSPKTPNGVTGTIVTGRILTPEHLKVLGKQLNLNLNWIILTPEYLSKQSKTIIGNTSQSNPFYSEVLSENYLQTVVVVYDHTQQPALLVKLNQDRAPAHSSLQAMYVTILGKIGIGFIALLLLIILLQRVIINPISKLIKHIISTEHSASSQKVFSMSRKDEIGTLANEYNQMCKRLQNAQVKLMEKSYLSGVTEMSSGILHNVRNAINPITNRLERLKSQFKEIPLKNLQQAQDELKNEALDPQRRGDLTRFVDLTFESVTANLNDVVGGLDDLSKQVLQIEDMLNIQRTFGREDKPVQFIEPYQLVTRALEMVPEEHREKNTISVDSKLKKLQPIPVEPSTFLQVLQNLLVNASESLDRQKPLYRKIKISASVEKDNDREMLHWKIHDNGAGITPEKTKQIFERGASSKKCGLTGIGLHWCANTITAMRGRIWAESKGPNCGATFHILIPSVPVEDMVETAEENRA